jgi:hypothetical protein
LRCREVLTLRPKKKRGICRTPYLFAKEELSSARIQPVMGFGIAQGADSWGEYRMAMNRLFVTENSARDESSVELWWQSWWFWALLALVSTVPFLLSPLPPLSDLFSHMGRYHVMLDQGKSPLLARYYEFHWGLLPNLGQDLLMVPFGRVFGAERGALILSALIPPAMVLGFRALSKAAHGSVQPMALLALPFSYSFTFLYGFMNYHTGLIVLLWTMVAWYRSAGWSPALRYGVLVLLAAIAWVCHLSAWALIVVAVAAFEFSAAFELYGWQLMRTLPRAALRTLPLLLPALLTLAKPHFEAAAVAAAGSGGSMWNLGAFKLKFFWILFPLRDELAPLDLASLAVIGLIPVLLLFLGKLRLDRGLILFAAGVFALFWILPTALMNGFYADLRLLPVAWFAALLACRSPAEGRDRGWIAIFATALFLVRIGFTTHGWIDRGNELTKELHAIDQMPQGARIEVIAPLRMCKSWANEGYSHLPSLAIIRRNAFANSEWDIPGQQLMQPIAARGTLYNTATSLALPGSGCSGKTVEEMLAGLPRDRFDYVWMFKIKAPASSSAWLTPVFQGPRGTLYAIRH